MRVIHKQTCPSPQAKDTIIEAYHESIVLYKSGSEIGLSQFGLHRHAQSINLSGWHGPPWCHRASEVHRTRCPC